MLWLFCALAKDTAKFCGINGGNEWPIGNDRIRRILGTNRTEKTVYGSTYLQGGAIRLLVIPIATVLLLWPFAARFREICLAVLIAAAAPIGSNVAIFAQLYEKDYTRAVRQVCFSTLAGIATMPVIIAIAMAVYG